MFTIYNDGDSGSTLVSNLFIDEYMKDANDAQIKIYLYLLRMMGAGLETSVSGIADLFNHTERDVLRSLRYWESHGLLSLEYNDDRELVGIYLKRPHPAQAQAPSSVIPLSSKRTSVAPASVASASVASASAGAKADAAKPVPAKSVPAPASNIAPQALLDFQSDEQRAQLLFVIEQYIGKPLAPNEMKTVYYISEELKFSDALIDYLLQYCIDRGKKDFRYIEKVAINWAESGITTPKQAERSISSGTSTKGKYKSGTKASANKFNQFEQNHYDFEQLEREILNG